MEVNMNGAELASMMKSSVQFKSHGGVQSEELTLCAEDKAWWQDAKIGLFFHWGLYSIMGRGEWAMFSERIPYEEYEKLAAEFNPQSFDMAELTGLAKELGAGYMVMVTRHHDGFALWDSKGSWEQYTSAATASGRDFVREYTDACRNAGLKVGLYYSPMDWRFPGYFDPKGLPENAALLKKQGYAQVEELCRDYGRIDILWYDGGWLAHQGTDYDSAWFWEPVKLNKMARSYNPKMLINPRSGWEGDFECDEGPHEISGPIIPIPWEKNMSISQSWAWRPDDRVFTSGELITMLANVICRNGNLLLNVGPDRNGKVDERVVRTIRETGAWIQAHSESIYGTRGGPFQPVDRVYGSVCKGNTVFLHILDPRQFAGLTLPVTDNRLLRCATYDNVPCTYRQNGDGISIALPESDPIQADTVLRLEFEETFYGRICGVAKSSQP